MRFFSINEGFGTQIRPSVFFKEATTTAFYNKKYKALYATYRYCQSRIAAIICKICAVTLFLFPKLSNHFNSYYLYYSDRTISTKYYRSFFKDNIINFGVNSTGVPKPLKTNETALFNNTFGFIGLNRIVDAALKLKISNLFIKKIDDGICMGISLHYLKLYAQFRQNGSDPLTSIKLASHQFKDKGSKASHFFQIIYSSLKESLRVIESEKLLIEQKNIQKKFEKASLQEQEKILKELESSSEILEKNVIEQEKIVLFPELEKVVKDCKLKHVNTFKTNDKKSASSEKEFLEHLEKLPVGTYALNVSYRSGKHAMVYIKESSNLNFLHDPNGGSVILNSENDMKTFWNFLKAAYLKNDGHINFINFKLDQNKG